MRIVKLAFAQVIGTGWLLLCCSSKPDQIDFDGDADVSPSRGASDVDGAEPQPCPPLNADTSEKIFHAPYLREHPELTHRVLVILEPTPTVRTDTALMGTAQRDAALVARTNLSYAYVECVLGAFGSADVDAEAYEALEAQSDGAPAPVGLAFSVSASTAQTDTLGRHPYVQQIYPAFGEPSRLGLDPPPPFEHCPEATDDPESKLDTTGVDGADRYPFMIDLRQELLSPLESCQGAETCDALVYSLVTRTVQATTLRGCILGWLDQVVTQHALEVASYSAEGAPDGPLIPPFGQASGVLLSFGRMLSVQEAAELAKHPYVARVWHSPGAATVGTPDCPPDYDASLEAPECSDGAEPYEGKFASVHQAVWEAEPGPHEVRIAFHGPDVCPRPECAGRTCPELDQYNEYYNRASEVAQTCVRDLVAKVGGSASPEFNRYAVGATLTWEQIQQVAQSPDVISVGPAFIDAPPP